MDGPTLDAVTYPIPSTPSSPDRLPTKVSANFEKNAFMKIYGHRGACGYAPENTIPSMRRALELGVDGIEFDVRLSRDGVPVVIHDETIDRTTRQSGAVSDFTAEELSRLSSDETENVPTLSLVLDTIGHGARDSDFVKLVSINVELKEYAAVEPTFDVLRSAVATGVVEAQQLLLTSFDHDAVKRFRQISTSGPEQFSVGLLTKGHPLDSYWTLARKLDVMSVNIDLPSVTSDFVARAHENDFLVMVYTVNTLADANRMRQLNVDAIFSDFPDRVLS